MARRPCHCKPTNIPDMAEKVNEIVAFAGSFNYIFLLTTIEIPL
jgi:hypothetical protein